MTIATICRHAADPILPTALLCRYTQHVNDQLPTKGQEEQASSGGWGLVLVLGILSVAIWVVTFVGPSTRPSAWLDRLDLFGEVIGVTWGLLLFAMPACLVIAFFEQLLVSCGSSRAGAWIALLFASFTLAVASFGYVAGLGLLLWGPTWWCWSIIMILRNRTYREWRFAWWSFLAIPFLLPVVLVGVFITPAAILILPVAVLAAAGWWSSQGVPVPVFALILITATVMLVNTLVRMGRSRRREGRDA